LRRHHFNGSAHGKVGADKKFEMRDCGVKDTHRSGSERTTMKRTGAAALAIAALLLGGCSASQIINTGGDTKCKDFKTQDEKKQDSEITKMLKDKSGNEPNNLEVSATRASALIYCQTIGTPDSKISEAPHG
jgi:acid stress chaperone HdeA